MHRAHLDLPALDVGERCNIAFRFGRRR